MSTTISINAPFELDLSAGKMTEEQFLAFCADNPELRIEQDQHQNVIVMPPTLGESGYFEKKATSKLDIYEENFNGISFGPNTPFRLPNGATRCADACWVSDERWSALADEEKKKIFHVVPDFVIEIRSNSDRLTTVKSKMQEWMDNGVRLAWLIDPKTKKTHIYREDDSVEIVEGFDKILSGEDVVPSFKFDLKRLKMP